MINKNDVITGKVQSFGSDGEGVVSAEGCVFFVPYALPGEVIRFKVLKLKGNVGYGKVECVIEPAKGRVKPKCSAFYACGGCQLQHADYQTQTQFKREKVEGALRKIGGVVAEVSPVIACESEYGYRNKLQIPVGIDENGRTVIGFYAERSHRIIPIETCYIHPQWADKLLAEFRAYIESSKAVGYDERTKKGLLRHLVAREIEGKLLITVVATKKNLPCCGELTARLQAAFPECSVYVNVNTSETNVIFGDRFFLLCGAGRLEGETGGIVYEAGAETFVQVNPEIREKLYRRAMEACFEDGADVVIDAYSGGGLMTAMAAKRCKRAYGVELNRESSACAEALKIRNGLANIENICGDAAVELPKIIERERGNKVALILDPPRAGVERSVLYAILKSGIERFVMISCNPATLARDLGILTGTLREEEGANGALVKFAESMKTTGGSMEKETAAKSDEAAETAEEKKPRRAENYYKIESIEPFDMFPQTKHVETLVCLSKKSASHIVVDVEFGEGEGQVSLKEAKKSAEEQKPKKKITYKDIQRYVEENYGFKVHTAYIAEVKRDLGLPMYDAPNAVEELKKPRQHPSEKMVKAIKDTLKYFEVI